jgi:4-hydroxy-tetrahydrodipicolinate reductase
MKIALIGYGKMGKAIEEIALQRGHEIIYRIDVESEDLLEKKSLKETDVAIEFTTPSTAFHNIMKCFDAGLPLVCGTTGWYGKIDEVKQRCFKEKQSFLYASNFSIGVNIFFELNKKLAELMAKQSQYEISLEEIHHTQKKDAPSGTAITLAEEILKEIPRKKKWVNEGSTNPEDLGIISRRIDPAPGTHIIRYTSDVDDIEIRHTAHSRKGFALGAITAAEWLAGKKGFFTMKDVLGL